VGAPTFLEMVIPSVPSYVSYSWLAMGFIIVLALIVKNNIKMVPTGIQNLMEILFEFLRGQALNSIGHHWGDKFLPLLGTIFIYILVCNLFGLIPGFDSPTSNVNVTFSMAIPVFFIYQFMGFKVHGIRYLEHFLGPIRSIYAIPFMMFMFIVEWITHLARPLTLGVRLFGNMFGKHLLLMVLGFLAPLIVPVIFLSLGTLVSVLQAYVFMLLTAVYIAGAVEESH
jgi:F-type H+-transporting ATPase subunit a